MRHFRLLHWGASLLVLLLTTTFGWCDGLLPVLKTRTETYNNVTLISHTPTHLFIQHSRGVADVKIHELDAATLKALGVDVPDDMNPDAASKNANPVAQLFKEDGTMAVELPPAVKNHLPPGISLPPLTRTLVLSVLAGLAVFHLFFSFCAMQICRKAGSNPGPLIWLPVLQVIPMVRAAGMSGWWFVAWFVPVVNLIAQILWCVKIVQARGKGFLTTVLLILPGTNILAFLYLAFSGGVARVKSRAKLGGPKPVELEPLPA
jgi:hypothetical protein